MGEVYLNGILRIQRDDTTRMVTEWDENGNVITTGTDGNPGPRPYTVEENASLDATLAHELEMPRVEQIKAALPTIRSLLGSNDDPAGVSSINAIMNTANATINGTPAPFIKALAAFLKVLIKLQIRTLMYMVRDFSDPDDE